MFTDEDLTDDQFLGGRLQLLQPKQGYRAANDPVFLAAACFARAGESVLDLGCGAGTAALCLGARVAGLSLSGLELQPDYADLARRNAARNDIPLAVHEGDLRAMPLELRHSFDHVIINPPYYPPSGTRSPLAGRALALQVEAVPLALWLSTAARRLRPGGWCVMIAGVEALPQLLSGLGTLGSASVLPLAAREGRAAKRVILRARKGGRAPFHLLPPFILHQGEGHSGDFDSNSPASRAILRAGGDLSAQFSLI